MWTISCGPVAITGGVNMRCAGLHQLICKNTTVFSFYAGLFQSQRSRVRQRRPEREQDFLGEMETDLPLC